MNLKTSEKIAGSFWTNWPCIYKSGRVLFAYSTKNYSIVAVIHFSRIYICAYNIIRIILLPLYLFCIYNLFLRRVFYSLISIKFNESPIETDFVFRTQGTRRIRDSPTKTIIYALATIHSFTCRSYGITVVRARRRRSCIQGVSHGYR